MVFKLDVRDKRLISYLYHHNRDPLTKIAKACKISRDQVEYRLKKFESQGLIKKYAPLFNYELMGYNEFVIVWLKLDGTKSTKNQIRNEFKKNKNTITYFNIIGRYDVGADLVFKDKLDFQRKFEQILGKYGNKIQDYSFFITTSTTFFPLKEFGLLQAEKEFILQDFDKTPTLDEKEIKILKLLEKNARSKIVDIASETGLSSELVLYKIKQLNKNKILLGARIIFDLEKFGYYFGILRIRLKNLNDTTQKNLFEYCKQHKYINALSFGMGNYNCLIQLFYNKEKDFRDSIKEILEKFNNEIQKSEIILIENEGEVNTLPF